MRFCSTFPELTLHARDLILPTLRTARCPSVIFPAVYYAALLLLCLYGEWIGVCAYCGVDVEGEVGLGRRWEDRGMVLRDDADRGSAGLPRLGALNSVRIDDRGLRHTLRTGEGSRFRLPGAHAVSHSSQRSQPGPRFRIWEQTDTDATRSTNGAMSWTHMLNARTQTKTTRPQPQT